jgi:glycosyltransferase involved in cell wall biosynthesis
VIEKPAWHLLTGEYPPDRGGIGDYTRLLARALADHGRRVHVWTPSAASGSDTDGVAVHAMGGVGRDALRRLGDALDRHPAPRRLLVQYAPQAWGMRGMNLPFTRWLLARRRAGDDVRVMFHEPYFPFGWQRPQRNLLAAVNRLMARTLLRASTRAYVSTPVWEPLLAPLAPTGLEFTLLPIPSTIPVVDDPERVGRVRREVGEGLPIVAHFGTYGDQIGPALTRALQALIGYRPDARILLLGNRGPDFAARLRAADERFRDNVVAPGYRSPEDVSVHLQAAGVAIQPYPDGADTRRTTLMACLANGVPTVTTRGPGCGTILVGGAVCHAAPGDADGQGRCAADLLESADVLLESGDLDELRARARALYQREFAIERTVERLLADEDGAAP